MPGAERADRQSVTAADAGGRWKVFERLRGSRALPALAVGVLTVVGAALRLGVLGQSLFADELSTYWIVSTHSLRGVVSTVHSDAEITPPLYFVLAWLTTQIDLTPELLRAPSLLAGIAAIPLTYLLGLRTVGRPAALVATALTVLSPFMIFYSTEARGYELAIVLVMLSTLAMLAAVDGGRGHWWIVYGASSCAAVYTHYTVVFALAAQLLWLLWAHPEARRPGLLANTAAVIGFLPWVSGLIADFNSPTTRILDSLSRFDFEAVRVSLGHWAIGHPYRSLGSGLGHLPGTAAVAMLVIAVAVAASGFMVARYRDRPRSGWGRLDRRFVLVLTLAVVTPVGAALVSAVGTNLFLIRNLAVSWPGYALVLATLLVAAGPRLRFVAVTLAVTCFAIAAAKTVDSRYQRPDYQAAANFIREDATPGEVIVDTSAALTTPGPYTALEVALGPRRNTFRVGAPQEREHPFRVFRDPILPIKETVRRAATAAAGRGVFVISGNLGFFSAVFTQEAVAALPPRYRRVETHAYPGLIRVLVSEYDQGYPPRTP